MTEGQSWETYEDFMLHGGLDRFTTMLARYELFKHVIEVPGDIVECGVYRGSGLAYWAKLLQIFCPLSKRKVVGFDTFQGYPSELTAPHDRRTAERLMSKQGRYQNITSDSLSDLMGLLGLSRRTELIVGDAGVTIEEYVRQNPGFRIALLNLDFDTYDATRSALEHLYRLIVPGGVVIMDEYAIRGWGESDAVDEFFKGEEHYRSIPWALTPTAYIIKH